MLSKIYYPELIADNFVIGLTTEADEYMKELVCGGIPVTDSDDDGCSFFVNFTDEFAERIDGPLVCSCEASTKLANIIRKQCITEDDWGLKFDREKCHAILMTAATVKMQKESEEC